MKRKGSLVLAWLGSLFLGAAALAQQPEPITLDFEGEEIEVDRTDLRERIERLEALMRDADGAVMDYLRDSTGAVQEGHRRAVAEFRVWYRNWRNARDNAGNTLIEKIVKDVFALTLNVVFPESTVFIQMLKAAAKTTFAAGLQQLKPSSGNVELFLDQLGMLEARLIERMQHVPDEFRGQHPSIMEAAKWEYVWNVRDTTVLPPAARNYLRSVGVPPPGAATSKAVLEAILAQHIEMVFRNDHMTMTGLGPIPVRVVAQISALRHLDVDGNKPRICRLERQNMSSFFWSIPYGECPGESR